MAKKINLVSTAYGAPWGGIQGTGVTATGIDLRAHPKQYVVAVDPKVIPLGTKLKIPHNPFGDPNIVFTAADTGGAIKGNRLDFYDWRGRKSQLNWGTRPIEALIVGAGGKPVRAADGGAGADGSPATFLPGTSSSGLQGADSGGDLASLLQAFSAQSKQPVPSSALQSPSFAAHAVMPAGYQAPQSAGGPAPKQDLGETIRQLLPALGGAGIPQAKSQGLLVPGSGTGGNAADNGHTLPGSAPDSVRKLFERASAIDQEHLPYKWGGGHGPTPAKPGVPLDCSGAVSRLLGVNPRVSGQFATFGNAGPGKHVTIYANKTHVLMEIDGRFWGTSGTNPGGGAGWIPRSAISDQYLRNFTARHPKGM